MLPSRAYATLNHVRNIKAEIGSTFGYFLATITPLLVAAAAAAVEGDVILQGHSAPFLAPPALTAVAPARK